MKKYLLAAVAVTALASPAYARDGQPYFGIEGGILFPKDQDADVVDLLGEAVAELDVFGQPPLALEGFLGLGLVVPEVGRRDLLF